MDNSVQKIKKLSASDLRILAETMGYADVVDVRLSQRIAQRFWDRIKEETKGTDNAR